MPAFARCAGRRCVTNLSGSAVPLPGEALLSSAPLAASRLEADTTV
ncbi:hypothetical protein ACH4UM_15840 [Streptomyces sp. NPDC020801]